MSAKFFLDTNVLVYSFDSANPDKLLKAQELIKRALSDDTGVISYQVIQEFVNVATRKFDPVLQPKDCALFMHEVLFPLWSVHTSIELYILALNVMERWQYAFYDSLIVASALETACETLYSEDLQHGQQINGLTILNPFME